MAKLRPLPVQRLRHANKTTDTQLANTTFIFFLWQKAKTQVKRV